MANKTLAGQDFKSDDRQQLKKLLQQALVFKETVLASGKKSNYYLDARQVTLSSAGSMLTARVLLELLNEKNVGAVGGLTMGADPIVSAVSALSSMEDMPINAFIVRKEVKGHGMQRQIEGPDIKGHRVAVVDDVVTSGGSLLQAANAAKDAGAEVVITTALVDRMEGASALLEQNDFKFQPIFNIKELL